MLARTRTLLADLLVRRGTDKDQAEPLYRQALEAQRALADGRQNPAITTEDVLRLGQTLKSQGDLLRLDGKFPQAQTVYDQAIAVLDQAHAADAKHAEIRNDLALGRRRPGLGLPRAGRHQTGRARLSAARWSCSRRWSPSSPPCPAIASRWPRRSTAWGCSKPDTGRLD